MPLTLRVTRRIREQWRIVSPNLNSRFLVPPLSIARPSAILRPPRSLSSSPRRLNARRLIGLFFVMRRPGSFALPCCLLLFRQFQQRFKTESAPIDALAGVAQLCEPSGYGRHGEISWVDFPHLVPADRR